jgi:spore maturation protein CgeB
VPEGVAVGRWALSVATGPVVFYDIDTPVTLARLAAGEDEYLDLPLLALYDAYLSFTGGPTLRRIEEMGSPFAAALYCSVDPDIHAPVPVERRWSLGYLGTYSKDRQPTLESLLLAPTATLSDRRFVIGGPQYPADIPWPPNVDRIEHVPPAHHAAFYSAQDVTLNVTRSDMRAAGYSPSVRLFEATACGVPVVSDVWDGLDSIFRIGTEILVAEDSEAMVDILTGIPDEQRRAIGRAARAAVLARHTSAHRAAELEATLAEVGRRSRRSRPAYA